MNEPLINLINYLRKLARQHVEIKSFMIGEEYELDEFDNVQYPLLMLELPMSSSFTNVIEPDRLEVSFNLHTLTNLVKDKNGNDRQVTEQMISKATNQISYTDLALQDQLMNNAFRILTVICSKIASDAAESNVTVDGMDIPMVVSSISITNSERVTNKDCYRATAAITLIIENTYLCPLDTYFDYNK